MGLVNLATNFNDVTSPCNPTPTLPCKQGRGPSFAL